MFTCLALPGVVAIMHGRQLSTRDGEKPITLGWIAGTALLNASGAMMYASKVDETTSEGDLPVADRSHSFRRSTLRASPSTVQATRSFTCSLSLRPWYSGMV